MDPSSISYLSDFVHHLCQIYSIINSYNWVMVSEYRHHTSPENQPWLLTLHSIPMGSIYGIFTYIQLIFMVQVGKYTSPMDPMDPIRYHSQSLAAIFSDPINQNLVKHLRGAKIAEHSQKKMNMANGDRIIIPQSPFFLQQLTTFQRVLG